MQSSWTTDKAENSQKHRDILRRSSRSTSRTRPKTENTAPEDIPQSPPAYQEPPQFMLKGIFGISITKPRKNVSTSRPESPANIHDTLISRPHSPRRPRGSSVSSIEQRNQQPILSPRGNESFPPDGSRNHPYHQPTTPPKLHVPQAQTIPTITHTPATPQRPGSSPPRLGHVKRSQSIDSTNGWYQPMTMDAVAEERLSKGEVVPGDLNQLQPIKVDKGKSKERVPERASSSNGLRASIGLSRTTKERRHGSFDFERSGWNGIRNTRASSILTSNLAGIGSRSENGHTSKPAKPKPQSPTPTSRNSSTHNLASGAATIPDYTSASSSHSHDHSHSTHQTQASANGQGKKGHSSSWGRSTEKKSSGDHSNENCKSTKRRTPNDLKLMGTTLGAFQFEPAVPSPNSHTTTRSESAMLSVDSKERGQREIRQRSLGASSTSSAKKDGFGFRSGTKGRSMDLGLGLSWAATSVREDALIPSAFGKSLSASSKASSAKTSRNAIYVDEMGVTKSDDSKIGREVNTLFKQALDKADYGEFRNHVHRFDADEIPVKGSRGILREIERLLDKSKNLTREDKRYLLSAFTHIVTQHE